MNSEEALAVRECCQWLFVDAGNGAPRSGSVGDRPDGIGHQFRGGRDRDYGPRVGGLARDLVSSFNWLRTLRRQDALRPRKALDQQGGRICSPEENLSNLDQLRIAAESTTDYVLTTTPGNREVAPPLGRCTLLRR